MNGWDGIETLLLLHGVTVAEAEADADAAVALLEATATVAMLAIGDDGPLLKSNSVARVVDSFVV